MSVSLTIQVHPLVVMNIADHQTRAKYRTKPPRVIGVILGKQRGRILEIENTIETKFQVKAGKIEIDIAYTKMRIDAYKIMYADLDVIGWYSADAVGGAEEKFD